MNIILNIGLNGVPADLSYTNGVLNPIDMRRALTAVQTVRAYGFDMRGAKIVQSDTEPTLVVRAHSDEPGLDNRIDMLSTALKQDCIAVWYPDQAWGQLIGPRAAEWGNFNPKFFIMPDGNRLEAA